MNTWGWPVVQNTVFCYPNHHAVAQPSSTYSIFPLGDSAITIDLGNSIDEYLNTKSLAIHDWLLARPFAGRLDIVAAYSSVTVFYDPARVVLEGIAGSDGAYSWMEQLLRRAWEETVVAPTGEAGWGTAEGRMGGDWGGNLVARIIEIPVCYEGEYAPDLERVAEETRLSPEEVIRLHTSSLYRVYLIGFLPGFPYLGRLDPRLVLSRKPQPESVRAGGVGIAGLQSGIYPLESPGGWWIIGRTPVKLFDACAHPPVLLRAGDFVRFRAIPAARFREISIC